MRRLREAPIDDAKYYETIWTQESLGSHWHYDAVRQRALARHVRPGHKVIDVGAGVWGTCQYIATELKIPNVSLVAYDQSYTARDVVMKMAPSLIYVIGSLPVIPMFYPGEFDVVIAGEIIEHMVEPAILAYELCRICKTNGWVCLSTVDTHCANAIKHGPYPEHMWEFEPIDLINLFKDYGHTTHEYVGDYHMIFCQVKR